MKNAFYFILKALFVLWIFKFLSWLFGHVGKTAWLERQDEFQNSDVTTCSTNNYNTQYTSQEVETTRQWNLVS